MRVSVVAVVALMMAQVAAIARADSPDAGAIQSVISRQIEALRNDDGETAYGFASPGIRQLFPSPDTFMAMVRMGYPQVYRPKSVDFGPLKQQDDGDVLQDVRIIDAAGEFWTAVYALERQPDGSWLISGCWILKRPEEGA
jgi:hypothetical protein